MPLEDDDESEASDTTSALLANVSDTRIFLEAARRAKARIEAIEQGEPQQKGDTHTHTRGSRVYLVLKGKIKAIRPYAMPVIFIGGVTTILADGISYGAPEALANSLALGTMVTGMSMAVIYVLYRCLHYHRLRQISDI